MKDGKCQYNADEVKKFDEQIEELEEECEKDIH